MPPLPLAPPAPAPREPDLVGAGAGAEAEAGAAAAGVDADDGDAPEDDGVTNFGGEEAAADGRDEFRAADPDAGASAGSAFPAPAFPGAPSVPVARGSPGLADPVPSGRRVRSGSSGRPPLTGDSGRPGDARWTADRTGRSF
ncbi:hypothetical protein [Parafrankia elaeagni]|uniref:hypothetical protein n=1 Tax=Parafrankia elaeagni TaxID=222534 RepID=UPI0012B58710|nr:hypothetical protein [Parafrankia elaeagni]